MTSRLLWVTAAVYLPSALALTDIIYYQAVKMELVLNTPLVMYIALAAANLSVLCLSSQTMESADME